MIDWGTIAGGAAMSAVLAVPAVALGLRERCPAVLAASFVSALAGPFAWNAILHRTGGQGFFVDIPFKPFPVSWQDTGSGVFTLAVSSVLLSLVIGSEPARRVLALSATIALVALVVDVYLY